MMKQRLQDLRQLEISDIRLKISTLEKEIYALRHQMQTSRLEKPHRFKALRKEIAQCKTVLKEKERAYAGKQQ